MKKIVVDTNIVFSAILNSTSKIAKILINSKDHFQFYTCDFLRFELIKHRPKLVKLTKLSLKEVEELELLVTENINFINEGLLPEKIINATEKVLMDIDLNDTPFVALSKHLKASLWAGDKILISGLKEKKFIESITTSKLSELLDDLERR